MKSFIIFSSLVYSLSLSLPPSSLDHMSLYNASEIQNRIKTDFESGTVQKDLMSFYVDPEEYRMIPSDNHGPNVSNQNEPDSRQLEVFGVKIPK